MNKKLIDCNGAVEQTSNINQVDKYLYIYIYNKKIWFQEYYFNGKKKGKKKKYILHCIHACSYFYVVCVGAQS